MPAREPTNPLEAAARRLRRRALAAAYLGALARHATAALFVAGTAALVLRFFADATRAEAALAFALVLAAPVTAWLAARRRALSAEGAAAWLDVRAGATGLLVTELELADERWAGRAEELLGACVSLPRLRGRRIALPVLPAVGFAALALWLAVPVPAPGPPVRLYENALERLREKLETLEETVALDDELAEELRGQLERLDDEADTARPEAAFEALDRLEERLESEALEAVEDALEARDQLGEAQRTALDADAEPGDAQELLERTMAELSEKGLAPNVPADLAERLGMEGLELPAGALLEAAELMELSDELAELLAEKIGELAEGGLLSAELLEGLGELGELADLGEFTLSEELELCEECKQALEEGRPST